MTDYEPDTKNNYAQRVQEYKTSKRTSSSKEYASIVSEYTIRDDGEYTTYEPTEEERIVCESQFCFTFFVGSITIYDSKINTM